MKWLKSDDGVDAMVNTFCFACNRSIKNRGARVPHRVDTRDGQNVFVGPDCYKKVEKAGEEGYQPPLGGPKLYLMK